MPATGLPSCEGPAAPYRTVAESILTSPTKLYRGGRASSLATTAAAAAQRLRQGEGYHSAEEASAVLRPVVSGARTASAPRLHRPTWEKPAAARVLGSLAPGSASAVEDFSEQQSAEQTYLRARESVCASRFGVHSVPYSCLATFFPGHRLDRSRRVRLGTETTNDPDDELPVRIGPAETGCVEMSNFGGTPSWQDIVKKSLSKALLKRK